MIFAAVPAATAQWLPHWRAAFPGDVERGLEARGICVDRAAHAAARPLSRRRQRRARRLSAPRHRRQNGTNPRAFRGARSNMGARSRCARRRVRRTPAARGRWTGAQLGISGRAPVSPGDAIGLWRSRKRQYSSRPSARTISWRSACRSEAKTEAGRDKAAADQDPDRQRRRCRLPLHATERNRTDRSRPPPGRKRRQR